MHDEKSLTDDLPTAAGYQPAAAGRNRGWESAPTNRDEVADGNPLPQTGAESGRVFYLRAYGCQMNQYEAGLVRELLGQDGYTETTIERDADVVLLLTCSVRKHAEQRALGRLQNLRGLKRERPDLVLAVLGCMAQQRASELANGLGADLVVGPDDYRRLPELIENYREQRVPQIAAQLTGECYEGIIPLAQIQNPKSKIQNPVTGMVTVMRGCDNYCSYCIVPYVRGHERSKSRRAILDEVRALLDQGVKEITLVGQNVLAYLEGDVDFVGLLQLVDRTIREDQRSKIKDQTQYELPEFQVPGSDSGRLGTRSRSEADRVMSPSSGSPVRIRFLTSHPKDVTPALAEAMRDLKSVCPHLHLPVQSGSNAILAAMNRRYTREDYLARVELLRNTVPGISLTTDVLVGFPGESDEDFGQTMELIERVEFDFAYMFRYSERPGTRAVGLEPKVPASVAQQRLTRLIEVQNRITREHNQRLIGQRQEVLVVARHGADWLARTRDGRTVALKREVPIGAILTVEITGIQGWTPVGVPIAEEKVKPLMNADER